MPDLSDILCQDVEESAHLVKVYMARGGRAAKEVDGYNVSLGFHFA